MLNNYNEITKEFIANHKFEGDGLSFEYKKENTSFKLSPKSVLPMSDKQKEVQLRKKMIDIVQGQYQGNYAKIDSKCCICEDTLRRYLKGTRRVTREAIAKFCVGLGLPMEVTEELFTLQGHSLEPLNNLLDAIVVDCIKCNDDITVFYDECKEYNLGIKFNS